MAPKNSKKNKKIAAIAPAPNPASQGFFGIFSAGPEQIPNANISFFKDPLTYIHEHIMYLNSSKFFAGVIMILLNVGSKFITIQFSKSTEEYLKYTLSKQLLIFAMAWMGTRDIYTSLALTAIFVILSDHLFNEESNYCIMPESRRIENNALDANNDGVVTHEELNSAITVLEKAKKDKTKLEEKEKETQYKMQNS